MHTSVKKKENITKIEIGRQLSKLGKRIGSGEDNLQIIFEQLR